WIEEAQATDPEYWARHVLEPVRFREAVTTLMARGPQLLLEAGPRTTLTTLATQCSTSDEQLCVASLDERASLASFLAAAGRLWAEAHVPLDAARLHGSHRRVALPTYPFERARYSARDEARGGRSAISGPVVPAKRAPGEAVAQLIEQQLDAMDAQL